MDIEQQLQMLDQQIDVLDLNASLAKELFTNVEARKEQLMQEWRALHRHMIEGTTSALLVAAEMNTDVSPTTEMP
jgi:hypothetical protein